jgi:hypothetical protein
MTKNQQLLFNRVALIIYCPLSCILVGLLSAYIGRIALYGTVIFKGGFLQYAIPFPGYPGSDQLLGLILGFSTFVLLVLSSSSPRPPISVFQVRVFLITLIWLMDFPIESMMASIPRDASFQPWVRLIFVTVHLSIAFLATFLPSLNPDSQRMPALFGLGLQKRR